MTRAARLAKAAAWERMAERLATTRYRRSLFMVGPFALAADVLHEHVVSDVTTSGDWTDTDLLHLHCLSEAARLRSGVPV